MALLVGVSVNVAVALLVPETVAVIAGVPTLMMVDGVPVNVATAVGVAVIDGEVAAGGDGLAAAEGVCVAVGIATAIPVLVGVGEATGCAARLAVGVTDGESPVVEPQPMKLPIANRHAQRQPAFRRRNHCFIR